MAVPNIERGRGVPYGTGSAIVDGVHGYYDEYRAAFATTEGAPDLPVWEDLTPTQVDAWFAAYATMIEMTRRLGHAMKLMLGDERGPS